MNRRLVRALQRGGVTSATGADTWSIWRSRDRRGRIIGTLSGAEIDLLRLRNQLASLGGSSDEVLIWTGAPAADTVQPVPTPSLTTDHNARSRSLLESLISKCPSTSLRRRFRDSCHRFIADIECASGGGTGVTMNWDSLAQGRLPSVHKGGETHQPQIASEAKSRLAAIESALGSDQIRFLHQLVLREASRSKIAKRFGLRPVLAERRGLALLRQLIQLYGV